MSQVDNVLPSFLTRLSREKTPLSVKELAKMLNVSVRAVYYAIEKDGLPAIRVGGSIRVDPVHAAKWLRERQA
jgi:excisionase family DNA binding protein